MSEFDHDFFDEGSQNTHYGNYYSNPVNGGSGSGQEPSGKNSHKKNKKKGSHRWAAVIASALVFGLIAGTTTYGVNLAANKIGGSSTEASASADSTSSSSGSETGKSASLASTKTSNADKTTSTSASEDSSSTDGDLTVSQVAQNAMPAMVTISTMSVQDMQSFFGGSQEYEVEGAGTGVILEINDDEVLIATNNHVITGAQTVSVGFIDESVVSANIKGTDASNDLAVVAVKTSDISEDTLKQIKAITIGDSDSLVLGQQVVAIGNALGYGQSVTSGYVSALNRELELSDGTNTYDSTGLIQTDAAINSGNSGGALLNMKGELVGINEAKSSTTGNGASVDNMGFAIPIAKAQPILQNLMQQTTKEKVSEDKRGYLGVNVTDVTSDYAQMYGIPEGVGITNVGSGSAAAKAGLQKGDIITSIGGTSVSTASGLTEQLQYYAAGDQVEIVYQRRGDDGNYAKQTTTVTLESKSDAQSQTGSDSGDSNDSDSGAQGSTGSESSSDEQNTQQGGGSLFDLFNRMMQP